MSLISPETLSERVRHLETVELLETGAGPPTHFAAEGTMYWDHDDDDFYINNDGANGWQLVGGGGGVVWPHNILSGTHTDTAAASPQRGDLMVAQESDGGEVDWARRGIGAVGEHLYSDGIDAKWWPVFHDGTCTPTTIEPDAAAAVGILEFSSRCDHRHMITCAAPAANLSVLTANAEGVAISFARSDHLHAITSSSNPGAAASILATDASGYLQLVGLGIGAAASAANSITMVDGAWEGIGAALERIVFNAAGYVSVMGARFGVGTLTPSDDVTIVDAADNTLLGIKTFSTTDAHVPGVIFMKSHHDTAGTMAATTDGDYLGEALFLGVNTGTGWAHGARMLAIQKGAASATYVETDLKLETYNTAAINLNQLYLDGGTGFVGFGTSTPERMLHAVSDTVNTANLILEEYSNTAASPDIFQRKGRGTVGSPLDVNVNDSLGAQYFVGYRNAAWRTAAMISVSVESLGASVVRGRLNFNSANAAGVLTELMCILTGGNVGIGTLTPPSLCSVDADLALVDGMAAPGTTAGWAKIYVDNADGDLKVKFGDGHVAVIAADS